jgi:hypothetical protein
MHDLLASIEKVYTYSKTYLGSLKDVLDGLRDLRPNTITLNNADCVTALLCGILVLGVLLLLLLLLLSLYWKCGRWAAYKWLPSLSYFRDDFRDEMLRGMVRE